MLKIEPAILEQVRSATKASDLYTHLQGAIELEHSTIPPYLTALYSIKKGANREAAAIIRSVVIEEMLHMTIAANTLNAIGGAPEINTSDFIPGYPGTLPMNIHAGFKVGLAPLSRDLISTVFMVIEEPEDPLHFPVHPLALEATPALPPSATSIAPSATRSPSLATAFSPAIRRGRCRACPGSTPASCFRSGLAMTP